MSGCPSSASGLSHSYYLDAAARSVDNVLQWPVMLQLILELCQSLKDRLPFLYFLAILLADS